MNNENITHLHRLAEELKQEYYKNVPGSNDKNVVWADSAYKKMAELLSRKIGINTIRKIFTGKYSLTNSTQKINTLSILCQFLGYESWNDFIQKSTMKESENLDGFLNLILEFNKELWLAYKNLPKIKTIEFSNFLVENSNYKNNLIDKLIRYSDYSLYLKDSSKYSILTASVKWITNKKACVQTKEKWEINFKEGYPRKDNIIMLKGGTEFKQLNYIYLFIKKGNAWKIGFKSDLLKTNYEDALREHRLYNLQTKEITYHYPVWYQAFQIENFDIDDEEFEMGHLDIERDAEILKDINKK